MLISSGNIEEHSAGAESGGNHMEPEMQHMFSCDRAEKDDVLIMMEKISGSSLKKLSIEFCGCDLTADFLNYFYDEIKKVHGQITTFTISYVDNIHELLEKTCFIIREHKSTSLSFEYDELDDESLEFFGRYLEDEKMSTKRPEIKSLDISYNKKITATGFKQLGNIMRKFNIESLKATDCDITFEKLNNFLDALDDAKLKELNIGRNERLKNEVFEALANFVAKKGIGRLKLSGCGLSEKNIEAFYKRLPESDDKSLVKELDVSYNSKIEPDASLGSLVVKSGVTKLSMAGCRLSENHIICLRDSMKNHKMDLVNMRDNASISNNIDEIARLVRQCNVIELNISDCLFSALELEHFRETLDGVKVKILHLGDHDREPDKRYVDELCALLANVEEVVYLWFRKVNNDFRTLLQDNCSNSIMINLTVGNKTEVLYGNKSSGDDEHLSVGESSTPTKIKKLPQFEAVEKEDMEHQASNKATEKEKLSTLPESIGDQSSPKEPSTSLELKTSSLKTATEQQTSNDSVKKEKTPAMPESIEDQSSLKKEPSTSSKLETSLLKTATEQQASNDSVKKEKTPAMPESIEDQSSLKKEPSTSSKLETSLLKTESKKDDALRVKLLLPRVHIEWSTTDETELSSSPEDALEDFLRQNESLAHKDKINLLQQIEYCLMQLHRENISCNGLSHSQIFITKNNFSCLTSNRGYSESSQQADIRSLANLYCLILTRGKISEYSEVISEKELECPCPNIALDIIKKMANSEISTMQEVMQHPFHWDDLRKVFFLCRAVQYIKSVLRALTKKGVESGKEEEILNMYNMGNEASVVSEEGWIEQMRLRENEVRKFPEHYPVKPDTIHDSAQKSYMPKKEMSVYELLHFFRNRYIYFRDDPVDIRRCFRSYPAGYLKFFTSRFPKLFMHVYNNMKPHLLKEAGAKEFVSVPPHQSSFTISIRKELA